MMITVINVTFFDFPALDLIDLKFQYCSAEAGKFYILKRDHQVFREFVQIQGGNNF